MLIWLVCLVAYWLAGWQAGKVADFQFFSTNVLGGLIGAFNTYSRLSNVLLGYFGRNANQMEGKFHMK